MSTIFDCSDESQLLAGMRNARQAIGRGDLIVIPTDTVYGVAADAFSPAAVQRLLDAKGRGRDQPPPVLIGTKETLAALAESVPEPVERLVEAFWPGGLTIVLPAQPSLVWDLGETLGTVAVRMPEGRVALELLAETGPLAVSSANLTGESAAISAYDAEKMLGDSVAVYLADGLSKDGIASTIVDATSLVRRGADSDRGVVRILRDGAVTREQLHEVLGDLLEPEDDGQEHAEHAHTGHDHPQEQDGGFVKQYLFTIILTALITFALTWAVLKVSLRFKLYPAIRDRDVHTTPKPRLGGVAIFLAIAAAFGFSAMNPFFQSIWIPPQTMWSILGASLLIAIIGVVDDLWDIDWMIKLGAQFLAAGVITVGGGLQILSLPFGDLIVVSSWLSITITMFAIVIVMNAVNFIDGLDGLVAGVCLISNGVFFAYSYIFTRDSGASSYFNLSTFLAAVLIGACLGFLPLNWSPAKIFMGDSGALVIGLLMATSAIAITGQMDPSALDPERLGRSQLVGAFLPILLPLLVVLLPLLDFGLAVLRRMSAGRSPFSPDRKHLHHRMLDLGHRDRDAVLIFYAWTAVVSLAVLMMYVGAREDWPGQYLPGVGFGVLGIAACLVVTLSPTRRSAADAEPDPTPVES